MCIQTTENDFQLVIDYNSNNYDNTLNLKKAKSETLRVDNGTFTEKQKLRLIFLNFDTKYSYFRSQLIKNDTAESSTITKLDDFLNINLYNEITYENKRNEILKYSLCLAKIHSPITSPICRKHYRLT